MVRSLWDALGEVADQRGRQGRHYELRSILGIAIAAMLAGANDLRAIFRWGRRLRPEALGLFGIESGRAPCHATYHYFFQALDGDALSKTLGRLALGGSVAGHIAIDGKTLRGSRRHAGDGLHVLSAFATGLGAVIGDLLVEPDANEITAALTLLKGLPLEGAIVTGDAIFTQREICRHICDAKGDHQGHEQAHACIFANRCGGIGRQDGRLPGLVMGIVGHGRLLFRRSTSTVGGWFHRLTDNAPSTSGGRV